MSTTVQDNSKASFVVGQPIPKERPVWLIDPVDGTTNFVHGHPLVAVSIGYCVRGIPAVGVIFNPFLDELYYAQQGCGAYCNDTPLSVDSKATGLGDCLLVNNIGHTRSTAFVTESTQRIASWLQHGLRGYRSSGCAAMNMAHVAAGRVSAFYEHGYGGPWDVAAGLVLVKEAGGCVLEAAADVDAPPDHRLVIGKGSICAAGTFELAKGIIQTAGIPSVKFHGFRINVSLCFFFSQLIYAIRTLFFLAMEKYNSKTMRQPKATSGKMHLVACLAALVLFGSSSCAAFSGPMTSRTTTDRAFQVIMPLQRKRLNSTEGFVNRAFNEIVDSTEFLVRKEQNLKGATCDVPAFGKDASVSLTLAPMENRNDCFILSVDGASISDEEFGWICAKFYECRDSFGEALDLSPLRTVVAGHFTSIPPHPGYSPSRFGGTNSLKKELSPSILETLTEQGYVVLDDIFPKTHSHQHAQLSEFLQEKTNQAKNIRRDTVHFVHQDEAVVCGMQEHFTQLMSIATHLNHHLTIPESPYSPMSPATEEHPLTVPPAIQLAEYGENDFYVAHSDNSLSPCGMVRNNFREYTCILYLNSNWTADMGGALRLYLNSRHYQTPQEAVAECEYVDILPENGRLLIFDSCLVHAVERVTQGEQTRRALTLWINRPNDSGVRGEVFY